MNDIPALAATTSPSTAAKPSADTETKPTLDGCHAAFAALIENLRGASAVAAPANPGEDLPATVEDLPSDVTPTEGTEHAPDPAMLPQNIVLTAPLAAPLATPSQVTTANDSPPVDEAPVANAKTNSRTQFTRSSERPGRDDPIVAMAPSGEANSTESPDAAVLGVAADAGSTDLAPVSDRAGTEPVAVTASLTRGLREAPPLSLDTKLPVAHPQFNQMFNEQITVLVEHGIKSAHLTLNPPELGPIDVRISFQQDEASIQFASHHGVVRDAVTDALPRLRDMLEASGVRLGDTGVFSQLPQREQATPFTPLDAMTGSTRQRPEELTDVTRPATYELRLVDAYV